MDKATRKRLIETLSSKASLNDPINPDLYEKFDVKRGLRNANGTGVLVGLTKIGDVVGYEMQDGKKVAVPGRLLYRGYNIIDLIQDAESRDEYCYEQCVYLLLFGELPNREDLVKFQQYMGGVRTLPAGFTEDMIMKAPSRNIMNKLARSVLDSYSYDDHAEDRDVANILLQCTMLISRLSTMAAYGYQALRYYFEKKSMFIHNPKPALSTAENFLYLMRPDGKYTQLEANTLDLALILHAEHGGGNNSSLTVHVVSSADTDTYSAISAAIGSLKGRRHGGANIRVVEMMDNIKKGVKNWGDEDEVKSYLYKIARKEVFDKTGLVYGMGHAVYTISDPRAVMLREKARQLSIVKGMLKEFDLYTLVERLAPPILMEVHHSDKKICANVDFYSGFVYTMLNIPRELFTPLFAIARIAGWSAHRIEEVIAGGRIYRPAYKNVCPEREYIPIDKR